MTLRRGSWYGGAVYAALMIVACGSGDGAPTSPSATGVPPPGILVSGTRAAIAIPGLPTDPVSLKSSAPEPLAPAVDTILRNRTLELIVTTPIFTYRPEASLKVTFELFSISGTSAESVHRETVQAGVGTTTLTIPPETLVDRQEYAWRANASLDGAAGPSSTPWAFETEFIVLFPPTLVSPIGGVTTTSHQPPLEINNGAVQGEAGTVVYIFELDTDPSFSDPLLRLEMVRDGDTGDRTTRTLPDELPTLTTFYWRVRGTNGTVDGEWSGTETFMTPDEIPDEIDPGQITWLHTNVSNWAVTSTVTGVTLPVAGGTMCIFHTKAGQWPVYNDNGNLGEGNPWVFANIGGQWYGATFEWLRPGQQCKAVVTRAGRDGLGAHTKSPPMTSWEPQSGEFVGFAMSTRARDGGRTSNERSNIVLKRWP